MAAAVKDYGLGTADFVGKFVSDTGRTNCILIASDDKSWAVDQPVVGSLRLRQRLAGKSKAFRILPHMALAHEGDRDGIVVCGRVRQRRTRQLVGDDGCLLYTSRCV